MEAHNSDVDAGTYRWPDFENPNDCGDYIPPKKQAKLTDHFRSQNEGLPSIGLKVPDTPNFASTSNKRGTSHNIIPDRPTFSNRPNVESPSQSDSEINVDDDDYNVTEWSLENECRNKRFNASEKVYHLNFNDEVRGSISDILVVIHELLERFLEYIKVKNKLKPQDFIRLVIISPELRDPMVLPWVLVRDLDVDSILEFIQKVIQSNDNFYLPKGVTFVVKHVRNPNGGGHSRKDPLDNNDFVIFKKGMVSVSKKGDDLCFGKAVVKALYHKNGPLHHEKAKSIQNECGILMMLTKELYKKAGVKEGKVSSKEYCKFQDVLSKDNIRLVIYSMRYSTSYIFKGPDLEHTIYLYHYDEHYAVISSMKAFLNHIYFCSLCLVGYSNIIKSNTIARVYAFSVKLSYAMPKRQMMNVIS